MTYSEKEKIAKDRVKSAYAGDKRMYMHQVTAYVAPIEDWIDDTTTCVDFDGDSTDEQDIAALVADIERQIDDVLDAYDEEMFTVDRNGFATWKDV